MKRLVQEVFMQQPPMIRPQHLLVQKARQSQWRLLHITAESTHKTTRAFHKTTHRVTSTAKETAPTSHAAGESSGKASDSPKRAATTSKSTCQPANSISNGSQRTPTASQTSSKSTNSTKGTTSSSKSSCQSANCASHGVEGTATFASEETTQEATTTAAEETIQLAFIHLLVLGELEDTQHGVHVLVCVFAEGLEFINGAGGDVGFGVDVHVDVVVGGDSIHDRGRESSAGEGEDCSELHGSCLLACGFVEKECAE
jgi:FtsZ-interacting cell division protein ZipA